jgi:CheY-like chemotaxis protein
MNNVIGFSQQFSGPMTEILLVDDNAIQAATRKAILTRSGRQVEVAGSAPAALDLLKHQEFASTLGLIVTDHLMPGMTGPEVVEKLRAAMPHIPVLVLSGLPDAELEYEGFDVIFRLKPFPPDMLIALAKELLDAPIGRTA